MDIKRETKNLIKFGCKSEANRKKAVKCALAVISVLNEFKEIAPKELSQMTGASSTFCSLGATCRWPC